MPRERNMPDTIHPSPADRAPSLIAVAPYTPRLGAEIAGVDLAKPLAPAVRDEIWAALMRYKVVFFRDQKIDHAQHVAFAESFGAIELYSMHAVKEFPQISALDAAYTSANLWHTDGTWRTVPPKAAILRGAVIPPLGGDTIWCDGEAAYAGLPDETKAEIDDLYAIHDGAKVGRNYVEGSEREADLRAKVRALRRQHPAVCHPIVRTHPETGAATLFLNPALVTGVMGMDWDKGQALLDRLHAHYIRPEYSIRFKWRPDSVAMWDERCTLHYGVSDYAPAPRRVERILIAGTEVPYR
jgi:taurine dioxygenase